MGKTHLQLVFSLRYQIGFAVVLVLLPLIALGTGLREALGNLFVVDWSDAAVVMALSVIMGQVIMITTELRLRVAASAASPPAPDRVAATKMAAKVHRRRVWLAVALALPMAVAMWLASDSAVAVVAGVVVGIASALLLFVALSALYFFLLDPQAASSKLVLEVPYAAALQRIQLPHVFLTRPLRQRFGPWVQQGHLFCLVSAAAYFVIYIWIGDSFAPYGAYSERFPALGYVVLLITLGAWVLPALAHWLDGWRVSPLLLLLILSFAGYEIFQTDHYYETRPVAAQPCDASGASPATVLQNWVGQCPDPAHPKLVVVAASGGGITAAAWTADVLTEIDAQVGDPFTRALGLISATSGGSVGAMYYLDRFQRTGSTPARRQAVREAASASSLREVAWGCTYPDLQRFLFPPLVAYKSRWGDRAWALEFAWRRRLLGADRMLGDWRCPVVAGELPVPLFNATIVDKGDLLLLTPVDLRESQEFHGFRLKDFYQWYPGKDIAVHTAARLSASFPYVTPVSRPSDPGGGPEYHLADGGYVDNFGMDALSTWLDAILPTFQKLHGSDILVIQIRAFAPDDDAASIQQAHGWWFEILGPVMTVLNVRNSSQMARNNELFALLKEKWAADGIRFSEALFELKVPSRCYRPPLSWQLSAAEKQCIVDALAQPGNAAALQVTRRFLQPSGDGAPS